MSSGEPAAGGEPLALTVMRVALTVSREYGFALAGGQALIAHGLIDRPTEDIDLFARWRPNHTGAEQVEVGPGRGAAGVADGPWRLPVP